MDNHREIKYMDRSKNQNNDLSKVYHFDKHINCEKNSSMINSINKISSDNNLNNIKNLESDTHFNMHEYARHFNIETKKSEKNNFHPDIYGFANFGKINKNPSGQN